MSRAKSDECIARTNSQEGSEKSFDRTSSAGNWKPRGCGYFVSSAPPEAAAPQREEESVFESFIVATFGALVTLLFSLHFLFMEHGGSSPVAAVEKDSLEKLQTATPASTSTDARATKKARGQEGRILNGGRPISGIEENNGMETGARDDGSEIRVQHIQNRLQYNDLPVCTGNEQSIGVTRSVIRSLSGTASSLKRPLQTANAAANDDASKLSSLKLLLPCDENIPAAPFVTKMDLDDSDSSGSDPGVPRGYLETITEEDTDDLVSPTRSAKSLSPRPKVLRKSKIPVAASTNIPRARLVPKDQADKPIKPSGLPVKINGKIPAKSPSFETSDDESESPLSSRPSSSADESGKIVASVCIPFESFEKQDLQNWLGSNLTADDEQTDEKNMPPSPCLSSSFPASHIPVLAANRPNVILPSHEKSVKCEHASAAELLSTYDSQTTGLIREQSPTVTEEKQSNSVLLTEEKQYFDCSDSESSDSGSEKSIKNGCVDRPSTEAETDFDTDFARSDDIFPTPNYDISAPNMSRVYWDTCVSDSLRNKSAVDMDIDLKKVFERFARYGEVYKDAPATTLEELKPQRADSFSSRSSSAVSLNGHIIQQHHTENGQRFNESEPTDAALHEELPYTTEGAEYELLNGHNGTLVAVKQCTEVIAEGETGYPFPGDNPPFATAEKLSSPRDSSPQSAFQTANGLTSQPVYCANNSSPPPNISASFSTTSSCDASTQPQLTASPVCERHPTQNCSEVEEETDSVRKNDYLEKTEFGARSGSPSALHAAPELTEICGSSENLRALDTEVEKNEISSEKIDTIEGLLISETSISPISSIVASELVGFSSATSPVNNSEANGDISLNENHASVGSLINEPYLTDPSVAPTSHADTTLAKNATQPLPTSDSQGVISPSGTDPSNLTSSSTMSDRYLKSPSPTPPFGEQMALAVPKRDMDLLSPGAAYSSSSNYFASKVEITESSDDRKRYSSQEIFYSNVTYTEEMDSGSDSKPEAPPRHSLSGSSHAILSPYALAPFDKHCGLTPTNVTNFEPTISHGKAADPSLNKSFDRKRPLEKAEEESHQRYQQPSPQWLYTTSNSPTVPETLDSSFERRGRRSQSPAPKVTHVERNEMHYTKVVSADIPRDPEHPVSPKSLEPYYPPRRERKAVEPTVPAPVSLQKWEQPKIEVVPPPAKKPPLPMVRSLFKDKELGRYVPPIYPLKERNETAPLPSYQTRETGPSKLVSALANDKKETKFDSPSKAPVQQPVKLPETKKVTPLSSDQLRSIFNQVQQNNDGNIYGSKAPKTTAEKSFSPTKGKSDDIPLITPTIGVTVTKKDYPHFTKPDTDSPHLQQTSAELRNKAPLSEQNVQLWTTLPENNVNNKQNLMRWRNSINLADAEVPPALTESSGARSKSPGSLGRASPYSLISTGTSAEESAIEKQRRYQRKLEDENMENLRNSRRNRYRGKIEKARKDFLQSPAAGSVSDLYKTREDFEHKFKVSMENMMRPLKPARGPLIEKFNSPIFYSRVNINDIPPASYARMPPSKYDMEYNRIVSEAERRWAAYKNRITPPKDNLYSRSRAYSMGYLETNVDTGEDMEVPSGKVQIEETDLDMVHRSGHSLGPLEGEANHLSRSRIKEMEPAHRNDPKFRARSADYLMDSFAREETEPPENQLTKVFGEPPPVSRPITEVENQFRRSREKLTIPNWYVNSEFCPGKKLDLDQNSGAKANVSKPYTEQVPRPYARPNSAQSDYQHVQPGQQTKPWGTPVSIAAAPSPAPRVTYQQYITASGKGTGTGASSTTKAKIEQSDWLRDPGRSFSPTEGQYQKRLAPQPLPRHDIRSSSLRKPTKEDKRRMAGLLPNDFFDKYKEEIEELRLSRSSLRLNRRSDQDDTPYRFDPRQTEPPRPSAYASTLPVAAVRPRQQVETMLDQSGSSISSHQAQPNIRDSPPFSNASRLSYPSTSSPFVRSFTQPKRQPAPTPTPSYTSRSTVINGTEPVGRMASTPTPQPNMHSQSTVINGYEGPSPISRASDQDKRSIDNRSYLQQQITETTARFSQLQQQIDTQRHEGWIVSALPADWNEPRRRDSRVIEVADTLVEPRQTKIGPDGKRLAANVTLEEVLDSLLGLPGQRRLSTLEESSGSLDASFSRPLPATPASVSGPGIYTQNYRLMDQCAKTPNMAEHLLKNEVLHVRCAYCGRTKELRDARKTYVACRHCYTYYCTRRCRRADWLRHKQLCNFARINTLCKEIILKAREDPEAQWHMSRVARDGYSNRGRGSVNFRFFTPQLGETYASGGWNNLTLYPGDFLFYYTVPDLVDGNKDPNLISLCRRYDPREKFILSVSVVADIEECPETPPPLRPLQRQAQEPYIAPYVSPPKIESVEPVFEPTNKQNGNLQSHESPEDRQYFHRTQSLPGRVRRNPRDENIDAKTVLKSILRSMENIAPGLPPDLDQQKGTKQLHVSTDGNYNEYNNSDPFARSSQYRRTVGSHPVRYEISPYPQNYVKWPPCDEGTDV